MKIGIIADSCCDMTPEMIKKTGIDLVPLKITVGGSTFVDDENIDLSLLRSAIHESKTGATSACPAPGEYAEAMRRYDKCVVITLSSRLSGSYNSAIVAKDMVLEEFPNKRIHIFDSESACSGETWLALLAHDIIVSGRSFDELVEQVERKIANMRTLFVLEDLSTLMKNGRLNKVVGTVATLLSLRPIMSDNGHGEIAMLDKVRGTQKALARLVELVKEYTAGATASSRRIVLTHCNCRERVNTLREMILNQCPAVGEVLIVATRGLSTVYANDGGVVAALEMS